MFELKPNTKLKAALLESRMTQRDLARRVGINEALVSMGIHGRFNFNEIQQLKISAILNREPVELFQTLDEANDHICPFFRTGSAIEPLMTIQQTANFLQVSASYVYKLIDGGRLRALSLPIESKNGNPVNRRVLRIQTRDLESFLATVEVVYAGD